MEELLKPEILLLSHKFDFSTDNISCQLREKGVSYFRLNRDELHEFRISMNPETLKTTGHRDGLSFEIDATTLKSIYYRAPTFPREISNCNNSVEEQLHRSQWAAFVRGLIIYENAFWVNNPVATYRAEIKPFQLSVAKRLGFKIPKTIISNCSDLKVFHEIKTNTLAIKTIDTGLVSLEEEDAFVYTSFVEKVGLSKYKNDSIPFIAQQALIPKIDLRITVAGKEIFPISITANSPIDGDWRQKKNGLHYQLYPLPEELVTLCIRLVEELGLNYGAIDLVYANNEYYFIEINPTGEWDWLVYNTGLKIDSAIANLLVRSK